MGTTVCQHRARVGGFYNTAVKLSTTCLRLNDAGNVLAFLILLFIGKNGFPVALFFHFSTYLLDIPVTNSWNGTDCKHNTNYTLNYPTKNELLSKIKHVHLHHKAYYLLSNIMIGFTFVLLILLCGDVHPNPGPVVIDTKLSIVHNNICSLANKVLLVETELKKFDVITLSETWLKDSIPNEKIHIKGFLPPFRLDREGHGGVAIYVKEDILCTYRPDLEVDNLEAIWVETKIDQNTFLIGCFYRPPSARVGYWDLIEDSLTKAGNTPHKLIVLGDFNTDLKSDLPYDILHSRYLRRIMYQNNLAQLINEPTRITDNTARQIDLILTTCPDLVQNSGVLPPIDSDHHCVFSDIKCNIHRNKAYKRIIYNYNKLNINKFEESLTKIDWNEIITKYRIDEAAESFTNGLLNSAIQCMPSKKNYS